MRWISWLVVFLIGCTTSAPVETIWLGHVAPLTGSGEESVQAMQLALEEFRQEGGSISGRPVGVRHVDVDGKEVPRAAAVRLLAVNRVTTLLAGPGLTDLPSVLGLVNSYDAPTIILDEVADPVPGKNLVLLGGNPGQRATLLARFALEKLGKRAALVINKGNASCRSSAAAFTEIYRQGKGQIAPLGPESKEDVDFLALAVPASEVRSHAVAGKPVIYLGEDTVTVLDLSSALYQATAFAPELLTPEGLKWSKRFQQRHGQLPGKQAILAHDGLMLLLKFFQEEKVVNRLRLREHLARREEFLSLTGKVTWVDGQPIRPLCLLRLAGAERTRIPMPH